MKNAKDIVSGVIDKYTASLEGATEGDKFKAAGLLAEHFTRRVLATTAHDTREDLLDAMYASALIGAETTSVATSFSS